MSEEAIKKLKPCPFCGGKIKEWKSDTPVVFSLFDVFHKKRCFLYKPNPKYQGANDTSCFHSHYLTAWNRRAGG